MRNSTVEVIRGSDEVEETSETLLVEWASLCTSLLGGEVHLVDWNVQLFELLNRMSFLATSHHLGS